MEEIKLTNKREEIFRQCLNAVVNGPFIPDWKFSILFGLNRDELNKILKKWPDLNYKDDEIKRAINSTLNNLLGYPIDFQERWDEFIAINSKELSEMYDEWKQNIEFDSPEQLRGT